MDNRISLSMELSSPIENVDTLILQNKLDILSYDEKQNGISHSVVTQKNFSKKEKECVELTLEDGRKITCPDDYLILKSNTETINVNGQPVLTSNNKWEKMNELKINEDRVKVGIVYPQINIQEEIKECNDWKLQIGNIEITTDTQDAYLKSLAFARIIGMLITDGFIPTNNSKRAAVFLGHILDVKNFINDLSLFCTINKQFTFVSNCYQIDIPMAFTKNIVQLGGLLRGEKVVQEATLPDFIMDQNCPRPIVREFLGGLFGGDGHTCVLSKHRNKRDLLTSVSFSKTKVESHLESLEKMMNDIKNLFAKCGIHNITIQNQKQTSNSKKVKHSEDRYEILLHITMEDLVSFSDKVGFRYCCHKSQRLEAGASYRRLREGVIEQHNFIVNRVDEITEYSKKKKEKPKKIVHTDKAIIQAVSELKAKTTILHEYAIPNGHDIIDHLVKGTVFGSFRSKSFPTAEQYVEQIGVLDRFLDEKSPKSFCYSIKREIEVLPMMNLKVISCKNIGKKEICVFEDTSFLINGVVLRN